MKNKLKRYMNIVKWIHLKELLSTINIEPLFLYKYCMLKYQYYYNHHILKFIVFAYFWPIKQLYMIDHALIRIRYRPSLSTAYFASIWIKKSILPIK